MLARRCPGTLSSRSLTLVLRWENSNVIKSQPMLACFRGPCVGIDPKAGRKSGQTPTFVHGPSSPNQMGIPWGIFPGGPGLLQAVLHPSSPLSLPQASPSFVCDEQFNLRFQPVSASFASESLLCITPSALPPVTPPTGLSASS